MNSPQLQNVQRILFYVEPWTELSKDFRLGAYGHYNHLRQILAKAYPHLNMKMLVSDVLYEQIKQQKPQWLHADLCVLELNELQKIHADYREAAKHQYRQTQKRLQKEKLAALAQKALGDWEPELVVMHETQAPFLSIAYPNALILHAMYGMTFKEPFPQTYLFDAKGLYGNSVLASEDVLSDIQVSEDDAKLLKEIKNWYAQQIIPHDPTWGLIEKYQSRFDKLLLLPLQVDGYYAFDECCTYDNQLAFLEDVLSRMPKNWGLVVTMHSAYDAPVLASQFQTLQLKYENLIHLEALNKIPYVSQALLPHVDAVVSVSSSLAFQTLLFDKPLIAAGKSHINPVAVCGLDQLREVFDLPYDMEKKNQILKFFFLKYHTFNSKIVDKPHAFYQYLNQYFHNWQRLGSDKDAPRHTLLPEIYPNLDIFFQNLQETSQWRKWDNVLTQNGIQRDVNPVFKDIVFHDLISWDLFDTLVDRPFIHPHELFQSVEDKAKYLTNNVYLPFHALRRESERMARIRFTNHRYEVRFNEIYAILKEKSRLDDKHIETLKQLELAAEKSCIKPRRLMKRTWEFAKVVGKTRSIITDIYLDEDFIQEIVAANGYGDYDQLWVSSETRTRKEDGSIYPEYLDTTAKKFGVGKSFLHIGDNPRADGEMARKYGLDARVIPKALDQLRGSDYGRLLQQTLRHNSYDTSIVAGMIANKFFSSPQSHFKADGGISNHDLYNLGYSIVGAFMVSYVQWVIRKLKMHQVDRAYFLARDGYLIMQVYEMFKQIYPDLPEYRYLLCSRRSVAVPAIFDVDNILETAMLNYGITTVANFLSSRFGLEMTDIPEPILKKYHFKADGSTKIRFPDDTDISNQFVIDIQDIILKKAASERELYCAYLKEEGVYDDLKIAMVDIGYSGTMQRKIKNMTQKSFVGIYMLTHNYVLPTFRNEIFEAWLAEYDNQRSSVRHPFNEYIPLLESMLSSDAGSFVNFYLDEKGKRQENYLYSEGEEARCFFVRTVQQGAMDFAKDFLERFGDMALDMELPAVAGSNLMFGFGSKPAPADVQLFEGLLLENMFAGSEFSIIANARPFLDKDGFMNQEMHNYLMGLSKWKSGAAVAYQKYMKPVEPPKPQTPAPAPATAPKVNPVPKQDNPPASPPPAAPVVVQANAQNATILPPAVPNNNAMRNLTKNERLARKLNENPKQFVEDARYLPNFVKKALVNNDTALRYSQSIFSKFIRQDKEDN